MKSKTMAMQTIASAWNAESHSFHFEYNAEKTPYKNYYATLGDFIIEVVVICRFDFDFCFVLNVVLNIVHIFLSFFRINFNEAINAIWITQLLEWRTPCVWFSASFGEVCNFHHFQQKYSFKISLNSFEEHTEMWFWDPISQKNLFHLEAIQHASHANKNTQCSIFSFVPPKKTNWMRNVFCLFWDWSVLGLAWNWLPFQSNWFF